MLLRGKPFFLVIADDLASRFRDYLDESRTRIMYSARTNASEIEWFPVVEARCQGSELFGREGARRAKYFFVPAQPFKERERQPESRCTKSGVARSKSLGRHYHSELSSISLCAQQGSTPPQPKHPR
jgi:hypothetical protein